MTKSIIVLTSGIRKRNFDESWKSDIFAHMRTAAATYLYFELSRRKTAGACLPSEFYNQGENPRVIVSGGKINGRENPSLSSIIGEYELPRKYKVNQQDVLLEENSIDTSENAEFTGKVMDENSLERKALLVTNRYHLKRAMDCFKRHGVDVEGIAAEDVLETISDRHARFVKKFEDSSYNKKMTWRNYLYRALYWLPYGSL